MQQDNGALGLRLLQALYNVYHVCCFNTFKVVEVAVAHCVLRSVGLWLLTEVVAHSIGCLVYVRAECGQRWCEGILGVSHKLCCCSDRGIDGNVDEPLGNRDSM